VYNLVENAIKYNHPLGQVTVTAYQRNKHVYLSVEDTGSGIPKELRERVFEPFFRVVEDTGSGIPKELRERVFEPFFRVDKSRSRELGGVGLGLAFVREIVRVHDGSICIKSGKTGGTIFEVTLEYMMAVFVSNQARLGERFSR
ncbi:ATP-binding protein, partial [Parabacteroides distasonis]